MIEALGNIGDFIGGFGVVVTVIYLAYQIRKNTASTKSASHHAVVADISRWTLEIGQNQDAARIYVTGLANPASLSAEEQMQFSMIIGSLVRHFENIHFQYMSGAIDDDIWRGWSSRILGTFSHPGTSQWWETQKTAYSRQFQHFVSQSAALESQTTPIAPLFRDTN